MVKSTRDQYAFVPGTLPLAFLLSSSLFFLLFFVGSRAPACSMGSSSSGSAAASSGGASCARGRCPWEAAEEMEMGSEDQASRRRRVLLPQGTTQRHISYEFLKADAVPCSRPGLPYYNCHALPSSNPYSRGCLTITRCARDSGP